MELIKKFKIYGYTQSHRINHKIWQLKCCACCDQIQSWLWAIVDPINFFKCIESIQKLFRFGGLFAIKWKKEIENIKIIVQMVLCVIQMVPWLFRAAMVTTAIISGTFFVTAAAAAAWLVLIFAVIMSIAITVTVTAIATFWRATIFQMEIELVFDSGHGFGTDMK